MFKVNEKSTAYVTSSCYNADNQLEAPTSMTYRIDCLTTGQVVRAEVELGAIAVIQVVITPADTAILNVKNVQEHKRVTFSAYYGVNDRLNDTVDFVVKNLSPGVS